MSASSDHPYSGEEENTNTDLTISPLSQIHYHPFRQSPWTSGQFDHFAGRTSQQTSPVGPDFASVRSSLEDRGIDPRPSGTHDEYHSHLSSFPSPPTTELNPHFTQSRTRRSAPDPSQSFGTRPDSQDMYNLAESLSGSYPDSGYERGSSGHATEAGNASTFTNIGGSNARRHPYTYNRDEFDGPAQLLPLPLPQQEQSRAQPLLSLPANLTVAQQDEVARQANDILCHCAFHFIAKYQFPIPIEREKRTVRQPLDREWTEWAYLLKRLATKRRIPKRILFDEQIKQLVTVLDNSIIVRQTVNTRTEPPTPRQPRDDRYILQLVSSGLQVAKILMDSVAMEQLNQLYIQTEALILDRRSRIGSESGGVGSGLPARGAYGPIGRGGGGGGGGGGGHIGSGSSASVGGGLRRGGSGGGTGVGY